MIIIIRIQNIQICTTFLSQGCRLIRTFISNLQSNLHLRIPYLSRLRDQHYNNSQHTRLINGCSFELCITTLPSSDYFDEQRDHKMYLPEDHRSLVSLADRWDQVVLMTRADQLSHWGLAHPDESETWQNKMINEYWLENLYTLLDGYPTLRWTGRFADCVASLTGSLR